MAQLPPIRRLLLEDFKGQGTWISPLFIMLNTFTEAVVNALNSGLTIGQNTTGDLKMVTLSSVPTATTPTLISWTKRSVPTVVHVGNTVRKDGAAVTLSQAVQVQWGYNSGVISITNVVGITPSDAIPYNLTLLILAA